MFPAINHLTRSFSFPSWLTNFQPTDKHHLTAAVHNPNLRILPFAMLACSKRSLNTALLLSLFANNPGKGTLFSFLLVYFVSNSQHLHNSWTIPLFACFLSCFSVVLFALYLFCCFFLFLEFCFTCFIFLFGFRAADLLVMHPTLAKHTHTRTRLFIQERLVCCLVIGFWLVATSASAFVSCTRTRQNVVPGRGSALRTLPRSTEPMLYF